MAILYHKHEYLKQLLSCIIREIKDIRHTAAQALIDLHQLLHIVLVSCHNDKHIVTVVLHFGD